MDSFQLEKQNKFRVYETPCVWDSQSHGVFCYGDEENARIYAVHLTTANQSKMRRAHLVSVDIGADWVENGRTGENPQPEAEEKQAVWVENGGTGENPKPEGKEEQAGWVENGRTGENPQPEAKRSSVR